MDGYGNRTIAFRSASRIRVLVSNRSTHFAAHWLALLTADASTPSDSADIWIIGDETEIPGSENNVAATAIVRLWDYQVGFAGSGAHASAVSGAATVIGHSDGPPVPLPGEMPEKWCGAYGVMLAMAECWRRHDDSLDETAVTYDVSAADILRSFCLQNSGGRKEMAHSWRRNGRLCIEHGGIFPMGFFACRDGHVAILGRSRRDWKNIQAAIGDPDWAKTEAFENPFTVARNSRTADALLEKTLADFERDDLLKLGIANQAVIAPVYTQNEAHDRGVFRAEFINGPQPAMPFVSRQTEAHPKPPTPHAPPESTSRPEQPLAGLRVIELCWIWSGPMVGQMLADLGAEVIKIESPNRFDLYRTRGLETMRGKMDEAKRIESSLYFHSLNRNKIGLSLDLKSDHGRQALLDLAARSHVLLENFTVGTLDRLGLGADVLAAASPSLIQLSMSGPGRGSSVEQLRSYGLVLSALGGAEAHIKSNGEFVGSPTFSISDPNAATFAALAALAAALKARETGAGLTVDLSQIEAAATLAGTLAEASDQTTVHKAADGGYAAIDDKGQTAPVLPLEATDAAPEFAACPGLMPSTHPATGAEHLVAAPWRVNGERPPVRTSAPLLGSGNAYVLGEILGMSCEAIKACEIT